MDSLQSSNSHYHANKGTSEEGETARVASRLHGKVVLIVGGAPEDVDSLARSFAHNGANLAIVYNNELRNSAVDEAAQRIKIEVEATGRRCLLLTCQTDKDNFSQWAIDRIIKTFGRLDAFITYSSPVGFGQDELQRRRVGQSDPADVLFPHFSLMKAALEEIVPDDG